MMMRSNGRRLTTLFFITPHRRVHRVHGRARLNYFFIALPKVDQKPPILRLYWFIWAAKGLASIDGLAAASRNQEFCQKARAPIVPRSCSVSQHSFDSSLGCR